MRLPPEGIILYGAEPAFWWATFKDQPARFAIEAEDVDCRAPKEPYYGREIGQLTNFGHGIKGHVFAVDESTLFVKGFAYDGNAPDAFFWVGNSPRPSPEGYIIPYPEEYSGR
uniref:DM13 domain-containing protein n=1 Tax=Anopheles stephensi TaxID=30069 RepID=A0A182XX83_ANOST